MTIYGFCDASLEKICDASLEKLNTKDPIIFKNFVRNEKNILRDASHR